MVQAVTLRLPAVVCDEGVPLRVELELPEANCSRSCWRVAKAVCALERLLDWSAADKELRACEISLLCWPPPPPPW